MSSVETPRSAARAASGRTMISGRTSAADELTVPRPGSWRIPRSTSRAAGFAALEAQAHAGQVGQAFAHLRFQLVLGGVAVVLPADGKRGLAQLGAGQVARRAARAGGAAGGDEHVLDLGDVGDALARG